MKNLRFNSRGFALVLVLSLLAILVLVTYAISTVGKVSGAISSAAIYQTQARQNALVGLRIALGKLQELAGSDDRITGQAGIIGISANRNNSTRHWCGVWMGNGAFLGWLSSGSSSIATTASVVSGEAMELLGKETMGGLAADSERGIAGKIPITSEGLVNSHFAFLICDEGSKVPVFVPEPQLAEAPRIFSDYDSNDEQDKPDVRSVLRDAIAANASVLNRLCSYDQLSQLDGLITPSVLQDNLHHVTLDSKWVRGGQLVRGLVNVNTNSERVWQGILQSYNIQPNAVAKLSLTAMRLRGSDLGEDISSFDGTGKSLAGPFRSIDAVESYLLSVFPATGDSPTGTEIMNVVRPMLTIRSDTFRIRAYGDAMNPADADDPDAKPEAVAYCEAIVQRTNQDDPGGHGKKFVITYFRWLGPDDI